MNDKVLVVVGGVVLLDENESVWRLSISSLSVMLFVQDWNMRHTKLKYCRKLYKYVYIYI